MSSTETFEILRVLAAHEVDFVIVGMTGAILQGVPAHTLDVMRMSARISSRKTSEASG